MKYPVILILLALLGTSCVTSKRCARKFPPTVETIKIDSIVYKDKIVIKDTTIFVKLPADTIKVEANIPETKEIFPITAETKYAKATASIDFLRGKINLLLIQKDAEIQVHIDSAKIEATYWREKYETDKQTIVVKEKFVPKVVKWLAWIGGIGLILLILFIAYKIIKR